MTMKTTLTEERKTRRSGRRGQATIELILTFFAFFTIFFMIVQVSLTFGVANYIQYATFMASRAFLAGYEDISEQKAAANEYLRVMVGNDRFKGIASPDGGGGEVPGSSVGPSTRVSYAPNSDARTTTWEQGVTYSFKAKLYLAPMIPGVNRGDDSKVKLESQSWLGREPTTRDCEKTLSARRGAAKTVLYDNGC